MAYAGIHPYMPVPWRGLYSVCPRLSAGNLGNRRPENTLAPCSPGTGFSGMHAGIDMLVP